MTTSLSPLSLRATVREHISNTLATPFFCFVRYGPADLAGNQPGAEVEQAMRDAVSTARG